MTNEELVVLAQQGDLDAVQEILKRNEPLMSVIVQRWSGLNEDRDYLLNLARWVTWEAVKKFDTAKPYKFSDYMGRAITNKFKQAFIKENTQKRTAVVESLEKAMPNTDEGTLADIIPDVSSEESFEQIEQREYLKDAVACYLKHATEREKEIFYLTFMKGLTRKEISEILSISQERVRQYEKRIVTTLKLMLDDNLDDVIAMIPERPQRRKGELVYVYNY